MEHPQNAERVQAMKAVGYAGPPLIMGADSLKLCSDLTTELSGGVWAAVGLERITLRLADSSAGLIPEEYVVPQELVLVEAWMGLLREGTKHCPDALAQNPDLLTAAFSIAAAVLNSPPAPLPASASTTRSKKKDQECRQPHETLRWICETLKTNFVKKTFGCSARCEFWINVW